MTAADRELQALKRELILARAATERAQLVLRFDQISGRTRGVRRVAHSLLGSGGPSGSMLRLAAAALGVARRRPWIIPAVASVSTRIVRSRALRWGLVAGAVAATAWWLSRDRSERAASADGSAMPDTDSPGGGG